jgi:hypothetical protein
MSMPSTCSCQSTWPLLGRTLLIDTDPFISPLPSLLRDGPLRLRSAESCGDVGVGGGIMLQPRHNLATDTFGRNAALLCANVHKCTPGRCAMCFFINFCTEAQPRLFVLEWRGLAGVSQKGTYLPDRWVPSSVPFPTQTPTEPVCALCYVPYCTLYGITYHGNDWACTGPAAPHQLSRAVAVALPPHPGITSFLGQGLLLAI